jgi:hypothetical protein
MASRTLAEKSPLIFFLPCLYSAATMVNLWYYGASLRRIDRQFATGPRNRKKRR